MPGGLLSVTVPLVVADGAGDLGGDDGVGEQTLGAVQKGRCAGVAGLGFRVGLGAGDQDALDGPIGRVADRDRLRAGGLEPGVAVLLAQAEHPLGGPEPIEGIDLQELVDHLPAGVPDLRGLAAAPDRRAHLEGNLLGRVVVLVGAFALLKCGMCLDQFALVEDLHHSGGGADIDATADEFPGHRVEGPADLDVDVRADRRLRPSGQHERRLGQRQQGRRLDRLEHRQRSGTAQRATLPLTCDIPGPEQGLGLHMVHRGERPPAPVGVADVGHGPLHPGLIPNRQMLLIRRVRSDL
ncbi:hypothetical protein AB0J05_46755 [Streptomyces phaeochromogenes]